jgi:hypothetical protein
MRNVKRTLIGVAAVAAVASGAVAAQAFTTLPELRTQIAQIELPRHGHLPVAARCGRGSELVSGGFATPDVVYAGGGPYTEVEGAYRHGDGRFIVKAENQAFRTGHAYSFAYCGDVGKVTVAKSRPVELGSFNDGTATAHCPDGLTAISGGWRGVASHGGRPRMVPFRSKRTGTDGWRVSAENHIFKGSQDLIAYAYCVETETPPAAAVSRVRMEGFNLFSVGSSCPAGSQAIAGGFDTATKHGRSVGASVTASRRKQAGQRWKVTVLNGFHPRPMKVFAYCVPLTG